MPFGPHNLGTPVLRAELVILNATFISISQSTSPDGPFLSIAGQVLRSAARFHLEEGGHYDWQDTPETRVTEKSDLSILCIRLLVAPRWLFSQLPKPQNDFQATD
jgi:hypothetical protein